MKFQEFRQVRAAVPKRALKINRFFFQRGKFSSLKSVGVGLENVEASTSVSDSVHERRHIVERM